MDKRFTGDDYLAKYPRFLMDEPMCRLWTEGLQTRNAPKR
jgi:hypothetical protein